MTESKTLPPLSTLQPVSFRTTKVVIANDPTREYLDAFSSIFKSLFTASKGDFSHGDLPTGLKAVEIAKEVIRVNSNLDKQVLARAIFLHISPEWNQKRVEEALKFEATSLTVNHYEGIPIFEPPNKDKIPFLEAILSYYDFVSNVMKQRRSI